MELVFTSILAFISTNIDDVFLLMLFFGNKRFKDREIIVGQLLGIGVLIAVSVAISFIGLVVDKAYIGLLGFLPIYFGVKGILQLRTKHTDNGGTVIETANNRSNIFTVSGVTIANGGDNIGIYVPLFATLAWSQKLGMVAIFFIMTLVWCLVAKYFTRHPLVARAIDRYGHVLTPFVLIFLGIYILYESGTLELFYERFSFA
jgi:cadmium resistance protein CadD (predicted permease)